VRLLPTYQSRAMQWNVPRSSAQHHQHDNCYV
jgi:hypothetical protein